MIYFIYTDIVNVFLTRIRNFMYVFIEKGMFLYMYRYIYLIIFCFLKCSCQTNRRSTVDSSCLRQNRKLTSSRHSDARPYLLADYSFLILLLFLWHYKNVQTVPMYRSMCCFHTFFSHSVQYDTA